MSFTPCVLQARIKGGAFMGASPPRLFESRSLEAAHAAAEAMSNQQPGAIFGAFRPTSRGLENVGWYQLGRRV